MCRGTPGVLEAALGIAIIYNVRNNVMYLLEVHKTDFQTHLWDLLASGDCLEIWFHGTRKSSQGKAAPEWKVATLPLWEGLVDPKTGLTTHSHSNILDFTLADRRERKSF